MLPRKLSLLIFVAVPVLAASTVVGFGESTFVMKDGIVYH